MIACYVADYSGATLNIACSSYNYCNTVACVIHVKKNQKTLRRSAMRYESSISAHQLPPLGKKRRDLRSSRSCYQDSWQTGLSHASLVGSNSRRLKGH